MYARLNAVPIASVATQSYPFFVVRFLSTKVRKGRGCVSGILREIDFQLFTSLTRMGSISEYFSSLLIPYSRCLRRNLKNPILMGKIIIKLKNGILKK